MSRIERVKPPPPPLEPGFILGGRYELEEVLGVGGAGCVYRATDRYVKMEVAVKVLREDRAVDKKWIERLAREVRVAREIRHPNVCRVHEFHHADGYWYLTMEYADGGSFQDALAKRSAMRIKKGVIPKPRDPMADARAICSGLAAIHTVGIVHRDVTPGNILRCGDRLLLTDFGLAVGESEQTTFHGGTPRYMAPEVIAGGAADQRSDVYQLGYLLHEVLFHKHPNWTHDEKGHRILSSPATPDADAVEDALADLCLECLSDNPALRPASAILVAEKLAAAERALPKSWFRRKWTRLTQVAKRPAVVATAALLCLAAGAAGAVQAIRRPALCSAGPRRTAGIWDSEQRANARRAFAATSRPDALTIFDSVDKAIADHLGQWLTTYKDACEATHLRGEQSDEVLDLRMACLNEDLESVQLATSLLAEPTMEIVENAAFTVSSTVRDLTRCSNVVNLRRSMPPPRDPAVRSQVERVQRELAKVNSLILAGMPRDLRATTAELAREARATGYCPLISQTLMASANADGLVYKQSGDSTVVAELAEALSVAESCGDDRDLARASAYLVYAERYSPVRPDLWAQMTRAAITRIGGDSEIEATLETNLGAVLLHRGEVLIALDHEKRAVSLAESFRGPARVQLAMSLGNLSDILKDLKRYDEALNISDRALAVNSTSFGGESFHVAIILSNRGDLLADMGRFKEATEAYHRALAVFEQYGGDGEAYIAYPFAGIGRVLKRTGRESEAIPWLEKALRHGTGGDRYFDAAISFDLAQALCLTNRDCTRGHTLALAAQATYKQKPEFANELNDVNAWLDLQWETGRRAR
jgi:tetratricopeptide (TPR) repeat protein/tRNA A-37 threonylcarbamoyl transferase component Bud32